MAAPAKLPGKTEKSAVAAPCLYLIRRAAGMIFPSKRMQSWISGAPKRESKTHAGKQHALVAAIRLFAWGVRKRRDDLGLIS